MLQTCPQRSQTFQKTLVVLKSSFSLLFRKQRLPSSVGCLRALMPAVAEPPKLTVPGALIFVARQLQPKLARTGSSSSEASIKATLFQDHIDNTHTKVSPEITTQIISYISEFAAERNLLQTMFRVPKYYRVPNYTNYSSVIVSAEAIKHLTKGSDVSIKPIQNTSLSGRVVGTS